MKPLTLIKKTPQHSLTVDTQDGTTMITLDGHTILLDSKDTDWLIYALQNVREQ